MCLLSIGAVSSALFEKTGGLAEETAPKSRVDHNEALKNHKSVTGFHQEVPI